MKLSEVVRPRQFYDFYRHEEHIKHWITEHLLRFRTLGYDISPEGYVEIMNDGRDSGPVWIQSGALKDGRLPVRFSKWNAKNALGFHNVTHLRNSGLSTMLGCPVYMVGQLIASSQNLTSLEGIPKYLLNGIDISDNPIISGAGIEKLVKTCKGEMILPGQIKSHVLGLLLIDGITDVKFGAWHGDPYANPQLSDIMTKHLRGDRDILDCQEELRTAGLREYGRL